ncbi:ABC transporter [Bombardia bombarda]|uniref:ABC transporter n=1 Tax=Bombardia bombarda TaxID=252184 RepID=A0AA39WGX4_9PEZI|nr:ABC transporter [Bombardia bombarda]
MTTISCQADSDRSFGPRVDPGCRSFDFTLQFEDIFFTCLPAAVFLILAPLRILPLFKRAVTSESRRPKLLAGKLFALSSLFAVQLAFLVLRTRSQQYGTRISVAADVLALLATGTALALSILDHKRSSRPSTLLSLYLSVSIILSIARTRTTWLLVPLGSLGSAVAVPVLTTAIFALTVTALVLESIENKSRLVTENKKSRAPEEYSGFWTRTCFTWLVTTFRLGYSNILSVHHLPALDAKLESQLLGEKLVATWEKYNHQGRHSLLRACLQSYFFSFASPVIPRLCLTAFTFCQPFLINTAIAFVGQTDPDGNHGKGLIGAWALVYMGLAISSSIYQYQAVRFTTRLRGGLIALVFKHAMQTRGADMEEITAVTLMGTDVERIAESMRSFHDVWASLLDIVIAGWLLGQQLSLACLAPIMLVVVFIGATSKISVLTKTAQRHWIERIQERLRITTSMLGDMKAVKMLGLTKAMSTIVQDRRVEEINTSKSFRKLLVVNLLFSLTPINLAPVVTFAVYVIISVFWRHETLLTAQAFTSIALIALLTTPVVAFIQLSPAIWQCTASFERIQKFCNYGLSSIPQTTSEKDLIPSLEASHDLELLRPRNSSHAAVNTAPKPAPPRKHIISFKGQSFGWDKKGSPVLKNLKVEIDQGGVTAIVGSVGCGKSAFLNTLLGEMAVSPATNISDKASEGGTRGADGTTAYCSQQPWLHNSSIRQNILGVSPYHPKWYDSVISACGLDTDITQLPRGDGTRVGSKGVNLSGGQKQRIALARAIYSRKTVYILDDVFSGMDVDTVNRISSRLFGQRTGLLRKNDITVVIATHSHKIMSLADTIIALKDGEILEIGSPAALLDSSDGYVGKLGLSLSSSGDGILDQKSDAQHSEASQTVEILNQGDSSVIEDTEGPLLTDMRRKNGDLSVYKYYAETAGYLVVSLYVASIIVLVFCTEFSAVWVKWWSDTNTAEPNKDVGMYIGVYTMFGVLATLGATAACWFAFVSIISNTAVGLHFDLLNATLKAPFRFFATIDSGDLLNRFSQDMELIDMDLPSRMVNYTSTAVTILAKIAILAIFSQYLGAAIPVIGTVVYFLQRFYLQTSRQVRLLGIEAAAPLYTHFTESVAGAATIRAFGWQTHYQERNHEFIDTLQRPAYLQKCIQTWLAFVLNLIVAVLAVVLVGTVVTWHNKFSTGSVGVSLVMVIGFSEALTRLIQQWTRMESSVGAVARIQRFVADTESEEITADTGVAAVIPIGWPQAGALEFENVVVSYELLDEPILKNISLSIQPRQHIAICGRSGSGKTSLILSLLKMIEAQKGKITLDGVDISTLSHAYVRSHVINVVPQDPFLMPGSIRFNLDPLQSLSAVPDGEEMMIRALERVGLWAIIKDQHGGLDGEMDETMWSAGQKQLFCLARAMVKKCKVVVLDEAMSSVDSETESVMQEIIDTEFRGCTVLAVMHRLRHVSRYDRVALLDDGALVEFGDPEELMAGDTRFAKLCRMNGN